MIRLNLRADSSFLSSWLGGSVVSRGHDFFDVISVIRPRFTSEPDPLALAPYPFLAVWRGCLEASSTRCLRSLRRSSFWLVTRATTWHRIVTHPSWLLSLTSRFCASRSHEPNRLLHRRLRTIAGTPGFLAHANSQKPHLPTARLSLSFAFRAQCRKPLLIPDISP